MRAGAREFLSGEIAPDTMAESLLRAAARRSESVPKRQKGKSLMFWGAKGGSGTTTLATNFAVALRRESGGQVALLDFNPNLGDVSLLLGLTPRFTIADALVNPARLDEEFISTLVTQHNSGVSVLAAPDVYTSNAPIPEASIRKLIELVGNTFPYFVIDAGPGLGISAQALFELASTVYLVTQAEIPSLRNCQRLITYLKSFEGPQVELVLNRFDARKSEFDDSRLTKALGVAPKWKVPNDYAAVRRACNTGDPLAFEKLAISQVLQQMARSACGKLPEIEKKKGLSLFS
jgi:pilus assembly protein CpaE